MEHKSLPNTAVLQARKLYRELYDDAFPDAGGLRLEDIEIASFNLCSNIDEFRKVGLGLKVVTIFAQEYGRGRTEMGHTGKILLSLPWQFLLEHEHADVEVLPKGTPIPDGYVAVSDIVNGFRGIRAYDRDGTPKKEKGDQVFRFRDFDHIIVASRGRDSELPDDVGQVFHFEGKSETFRMMYGDGVLLADDAAVLQSAEGFDTSRIPEGFEKRLSDLRKEQKITTTGMVYMAPGTEVLLTKHTKHAFVAGRKGAVFLEFSTPSLDEADIFTDKRVIR